MSMQVMRRFKMTNAGGNVKEKFRESFRAVEKDLLRWFPGHMNKGIQQMSRQLKNVDCVIEVHDARVPISGHFADFNNTLTTLKPHIFLLNKSDLADTSYNDHVLSELRNQGLSNVLFTNVKDKDCKGVEKLLPLAKKLITESNRFNRSNEPSFNIMVIGIPNVGKSSLINRLRSNNLAKGKAVQVGAVAGVTRALQTRVKIFEDPDIFVLDTPGILAPKIKDVQCGLKLALVGCMQDHLIGNEILADYLLFWLNKNQKFEYVNKLGLPEPTDDIFNVLLRIAAKHRKTLSVKHYDGKLITKPDFQFSAIYFINSFRKGQLGKYCLDEDLLNLSDDLRQRNTA